MKTFHNFQDALQTFQTEGGAMRARITRSKPAKTVWLVGTYGEIQRRIVRNPKECTIEALGLGGLCEERILREMKDWID